jgi:hypothetical protein
MPKFYRGEQSGLAYRARAVGWRRIPLLNLIPYLTDDRIFIRLDIKAIAEGQTWEEGVLNYEPSKDYIVWPFEYQNSSSKVLSKCYFPANKWWSGILPLRGGTSFYQPETIVICKNKYNWGREIY